MTRLDAELVRRGLARSRGQAHELVSSGVVEVEGQVASKPAAAVDGDTTIRLTAEPERWVGRAAYKLLAALEAFAPEGLRVGGRRCLDVGASTGGFTQVLLEAGAAHVTALDVGHGQLVRRIADDPRVEERSGTNIRDVGRGDLGPAYDLVVADLSFISLRLALAPMAQQVSPDGDLVLLVKPQFEVGRDRISRTGVVRSTHERRRVLHEVVEHARQERLEVLGLVPSPLPGGDGNREYLLWVSPRPGRGPDPTDIDTLIEQLEDDR
ncbi:MAG: TlyA family RNA methyltransferase [Lapillicoccus sp.]